MTFSNDSFLKAPLAKLKAELKVAAALPLNALNAFLVAARVGSFSKAADELHVTPAAVSQQIRQLEDTLDVALFHRLSRGLALTDAGQAGLSELQSGFDSIQSAVTSMRSATQRKELNIWTSPSFASKWLMVRMHRFVAAHPSIDLRISGSVALIDSDATAPSLSADILKSHNIDLAIRFGSGNYPGCDVEKLLDVHALPLCSPSYLNDSTKPALKTPRDLSEHTLLHDESPYEGRPKWSDWFNSNGVDNVEAAHNIYFNSVLLALSAAVAGQGVVLTLEQLAQDDINEGRLVPVFDTRSEVEHAYHLVTLQGANHDTKVQAFRDWIVSELASQ